MSVAGLACFRLSESSAIADGLGRADVHEDRREFFAQCAVREAVVAVSSLLDCLCLLVRLAWVRGCVFV